jgi:hypothetical protein
MNVRIFSDCDFHKIREIMVYLCRFCYSDLLNFNLHLAYGFSTNIYWVLFGCYKHMTRK